MTLWPFRKRSKTNSGDKIEKGTRKDDGPRQHKGKQPEPRRVAIPEFPLPPDHSGFTFLPQKQHHQGGYSSYFLENTQSHSDSSDSTHLPHKPNLLRKLSKKKESDQSRNGQNAYITPPTSGAENSPPEMKKPKTRFGRVPSTKKKSAFNWLGQERSTTFPPPARDVTSSLSSSSSVRPLKPHLKGFEKFTPRPKVYFGYETPAATPEPSRSQSGRRHRLVSEEELAASSTVDGLADDLDARGLREAMDRDRRRREKKKLEDQQRLERRLERRLMKQKAAEEMEFDADNEIGDSSLAGPAYPRGTRPGAPLDQPDGAQTPVSWLRDPSTDDLSYTVQRPALEKPPRGSSTHVIEEPSVEIAPEPSTEGAGRAKWTSFLRGRTASRIRKEQANNRIRVGESALASGSDGEDAHHHQPSGLSQLFQGGTKAEAQPAPIHVHHDSQEQANDYNGESRSGSQSSWHSSGVHGFSGYQSEGSRPIRSVASRLTEPLMDSPTIPVGITEISHSTHATHSEIAQEGQNVASSASMHKYDSRAVSPNAPSHISTLASIDSEGSWFSGKMSRQSFSRQSGNISRQSISRQSNHPSPLKTSITSSPHRFEPDAGDDETEDDEFYAKIESSSSRPEHLGRDTFEEEDEDMDRNEQIVLELSEADDSDGGYGRTNGNGGRVREGFAKNPKVHNPEWRMSSKIEYLKYYDEEEEGPPSPTAATLGGYESPSPPLDERDYQRRPLQHPFAEEGANFVTPLEHLAETRPRYTGIIS